jgi:hypothetical protein
MTTNRWLRISKWFVSLLALAFLLLIAAWLASNWNDAPPQPRPAALQLPSPSLLDDRNAYFAFTGLLAAPDRDLSSAGQALWKRQLATAVAPRAPPIEPATNTYTNARDDALGKALPSLSGSPLVCDTHMDGCVALWIENAGALSTQRKEHGLLGQRCESLLDNDLQFDEVLAPMRTVAEPMAQHGVGASNCSRWFLSGAALAWAQGDRTRTIALLTKADRMNRALLAGSNSLIGQMIAIRVTRNTLGAMTALGVRDKSMSTALVPLLAPLPDQAQSVKRWMAVEAAFQVGLNAEISQSCLTEPTRIMTDYDPTADDGPVAAWLCRHRIGWHPERNAQAIDAHWLHAIRQLDDGLIASIQAQTSQGMNGAGTTVFDLLTWRNTLGSAAFAVGHSMYGSYLARHADLGLHHEASALALQVIAAGVLPAERSAWLARQPVSPASKDRITWSDDGLVLSARTWQETSVPGVQPSPRDAIRIAWPTPR